MVEDKLRRRFDYYLGKTEIVIYSVLWGTSHERQGDQTIIGHHATKHFATTVPGRNCPAAYFSCCGTHHSGMILLMRSFRTRGPHCG
jgi:hypothetical protein